MEKTLEKLLKEIELETSKEGLTEKGREFLTKLRQLGETNFSLYVKYYNRYISIKGYKEIFPKQQ